MAEVQENTLALEDTLEGFVDDAEDETPLEIPPERRRVNTDKQDLPVETLHTWVNGT